MEQNPKSIEATVIAKDAVDDEPTVAARSMNGGKKKKRASGRARRVTAVATKASVVAQPSSSASGTAKGKQKPVVEERVQKNRVRETRIERMMSKAELARRAGISVLTIDRVEKGLGCRMDTKRKILEALGLSLADRVRVFGEEE
jgi:ribosome-binding protein aMBF1 (putative translation factor)